MVKSKDCFEKWGDPETKHEEHKYMVLWDVPEYINKAIPALPNRIYCNRQMVVALEVAFYNVVDRGLQGQIKTFDGCFNVRKAKGYDGWSLHSWGIAIDLNAAWNGWNKKPQMSKELVQCFKDAGFDWGGDWKKTPDGMHFQLSYIN